MFLCAHISAQTSGTKRKLPPVEINFNLSSYYDNNILKYSDKYLERFKNREDEGRFHIKTYDDLVLNPSIELITTLPIFKKRKTRINLEFNRRQYLVNDIKTWNYYTFGIEQSLSKRINLKFEYNYLPHFYVRHFRDKQWVALYGYTSETFQPFGFSKNDYSLYGQYLLFKDTRLRLIFGHADYFHNQHFTEYNCANNSIAFKLLKPLFKKFRVELGYQFEKSKAKAYDASYQTKETSQGPDASYAEDEFNCMVNYRLPSIFKLSHAIEGETFYANRYFSSKFPLEYDEEHAGRVDHNLRFLLTYSVILPNQMKISAFYNWFKRDTETSAVVNQAYLSDEKDYNQSLIGLKIVYKLKI
jgi:hypothetical protein